MALRSPAFKRCHWLPNNCVLRSLLPHNKHNYRRTPDLFLQVLLSMAFGTQSCRHYCFFLLWLCRHKVIVDSCPGLLGYKNIDLMTRRALRYHLVQFPCLQVGNYFILSGQIKAKSSQGKLRRFYFSYWRLEDGGRPGSQGYNFFSLIVLDSCTRILQSLLFWAALNPTDNKWESIHIHSFFWLKYGHAFGLSF